MKEFPQCLAVEEGLSSPAVHVQLPVTAYHVHTAAKNLSTSDNKFFYLKLVTRKQQN
jgi:hypothetical protein